MPATPHDDHAVAVRRIQPYEAVKSYRCPGCDGEIFPGTGHVVVVPHAAPDLRRHWHLACWDARFRRRPRAPRSGRR